MRTRFKATICALSLVALAGARAPQVPESVDPIPVSMLVDLGSGQVLESRQPNLSFVPASVTKVMTAYVAFEAMAEGRLDPNATMTVPETIAKEWRGQGTSLFLSAGDVVPVETLLRGITTVSANDAAVVLAAGHAGSVEGWSFLMNDAARQLGMTASRFNTPNGWPDEGRTYVSAADLVKLASAIIRRYPDMYHRYFGQKRLTFNGIEQVNHDPTIGVVPGADGLKTGYTREAGYNFLGSAQRGGRRLVLVLGGAPRPNLRSLAAIDLFEWGFSQWSARPLYAPSAVVSRARVQGGDQRQLPLVVKTMTYATVPAGASLPIRLTVRYDGPLVAPIAKGAQVGELEIRAGDLPPGRVPLYAGAAVQRAGPLDRLVNGVLGVFS